MKKQNIVLTILAVFGVLLIVHGVTAEEAPPTVKSFDETTIVIRELNLRLGELQRTTERSIGELQRTTERSIDELQRTTVRSIDELQRTTERSIDFLIGIGGGTIVLITAVGGWLTAKLLEMTRSQAKIESTIMEIYHILVAPRSSPGASAGRTTTPS